jgi:exodeoxyribonuclease-3
LKTIIKKNKLQDFLSTYKPSILCLNETKLTDSDIAAVTEQLKDSFTHLHFACCKTRKNYGGVAILTNQEVTPVSAMEESLAEGRMVAVEFG